MRSPWNRAAVLALATCGFSSFSLLSGCKTDVETANEAVRKDLESATVSLESGKPDAAAVTIPALQKSAGSKGASPEAQIESNSLLAQTEIAAADSVMNGDNGIAQHEARIAGILGSMATLTGQIDVNNVNVAGYRALDPSEGRKAIDQAVSGAQKGDNGIWFPGTAPIPSLDGVKQREADLQKQIADLTKQRDDLNAQRTQALQQAGKFGQQADASSGKESVGFYTQAANQRKEAADDGTKIDAIEGQLVPLQQDLATATVQEKTLTDLVAGFNDQSQKLENGWKSVQQHIDEAGAFSKSLLDGSGDAAPTPAASPAAAPADSTAAAGATPATAPSAQPARALVALGMELANQMGETQDARAKAIEYFNSAWKHLDAAQTTAKSFTGQLTTQSGAQANAKLPERRAWQDLIALNTPAGFELRQAGIQTRLAQIYADQYAELAQRNRLAAQAAPVLKQSGLNVSPSMSSVLPTAGAMPADVETQLKGIAGDLKSDAPPFDKDATALAEMANANQSAPAVLQAIVGTQAELSYKWAGSLLNDVISNAPTDEYGQLMANVAHAAQMANYYGFAQFALMEGKQPESDANLKTALAERDLVAQNNARGLLPGVLPVGLAFPIQAAPPPTSAPAGVPAAPPEGTPPAPATQPADATTTPATPTPATAPADATPAPATAPTPADATTPPSTAPAAPPDATTPPAPATAPTDATPATPPATPPAPPAQ